MNIWAGKLERNQQCLAAIGLVASQKMLGENAAGVLGQPVQLPPTETARDNKKRTELLKVHPTSD